MDDKINDCINKLNEIRSVNNLIKDIDEYTSNDAYIKIIVLGNNKDDHTYTINFDSNVVNGDSYNKINDIVIQQVEILEDKLKDELLNLIAGVIGVISE
jgi:hypothetical protein